MAIKVIVSDGSSFLLPDDYEQQGINPKEIAVRLASEKESSQDTVGIPEASPEVSEESTESLETDTTLDLEQPLEELTLPAEEPIDPFIEDDDEMEEVREVPGKAILEVIGSKEAPKGYNQVYGKNKEIPLDEMTINEVLEWQKDVVKKGSPSSAVGRYQFIRKTLRDVTARMGISGDTKMTPQLQDEMGQFLLERRGYNKYIRGDISLEEFANNLSKEWASLPVVTDVKRGKRTIKKGSSYYSGDGLNKALIDVDSYLQSLEPATTVAGEVKEVDKIPSNLKKVEEGSEFTVTDEGKMPPGDYQRDDGTFFTVTRKGEVIEYGA